MHVLFEYFHLKRNVYHLSLVRLAVLLLTLSILSSFLLPLSFLPVLITRVHFHG